MAHAAIYSNQAPFLPVRANSVKSNFSIEVHLLPAIYEKNYDAVPGSICAMNGTC